MRSMARAACERTGVTRKSLSVGSLFSRGIATWACCVSDAGAVESVPEGVGADGRALAFEFPGTVRADAQKTLPASRQSRSAGTSRSRQECIFRTKAKAQSVADFSLTDIFPKKARPLRTSWGPDFLLRSHCSSVYWGRRRWTGTRRSPVGPANFDIALSVSFIGLADEQCPVIHFLPQYISVLEAVNRLVAGLQIRSKN